MARDDSYSLEVNIGEHADPAEALLIATYAAKNWVEIHPVEPITMSTTLTTAANGTYICVVSVIYKEQYE